MSRPKSPVKSAAAGRDPQAEARLLAALRERGEKDDRPLSLVKADAAVLGGLPEDQAETALRGLLSEYRSHLLVTDEGELVYQFAPGLQRRDAAPLSERAAAALRPVVSALYRGFTVAFKIWIAATLVLYTVVFAVLGLALAAASEDEGPGGWLLWWLLPDWAHGRRDPDPGGRLRDERPGKRFHRSVFDFVFGPASGAGPGRPGDADDDRLLLQYIRDRKGRISASDLVLLFGWDLRRAEEEATRLLVRYDGEPEVADNGALVYSFRGLRRTAEGVPGPALASCLPYHALWEVQPQLTGNGGGTNVAICALNSFNLVCALSLGPWAAAVLELSPLLTVLLSVVPLCFSLIFFGVPVGRYLAERVRRQRRLRRNLRRALLGAIFERQGEPTDRDELHGAALRRLGRMRGFDEFVERRRAGPEVWDRRVIRLAHEELERLLRDLEGDVALPPPGAGEEALDIAGRADVRYEFPRLREERLAVAEAQARAADGERQIGEVIFSSASEGAGG